MEFKDLVKKRRSCRGFLSEVVSAEQLEFILEAARWAPSPLNLQPFETVIVTDPIIKRRIREIAEDAQKEVARKDGPKWAQQYDMQFLEEAPVLLVVVVDLTRAGLGKYFGQKYGSIQAGSAFIQNLLLAATDIGLSALWFTFFNPEDLRHLLIIPDNMEILAVVPVGKPKVRADTVPRKALKLYGQSYGTPYIF